MTEKEIKKTLSTLKSAFPKAYENLTYEDGLSMIESWSRMFRYTDSKAMEKAVDTLIAVKTSDYYPSVSDINRELSKLEGKKDKYYKSPGFIKAVHEWNEAWDAGLDPITMKPRAEQPYWKGTQ